jgi:3-oxoadipate enol-lactonase/4-carboxymuconolactone decarboxylase
VIPTFRVEGPTGAPALVLANSLGTSASMWDPQMPALSPRFRVIRYEHRGHGGVPAAVPGPYSIADLGGDVVDLLDHLGIERASICGVSLGGMVALWVAAQRPDRVDRLVLACTAARLGSPEGWAERAATVRAQGTGVLLGPLLGRWFTPPWLAAHPDAEATVAAMLAQADPEGYAGCCEAIGSMDQTAGLGAVAAPTLVIAGADDPVTPPALGLQLQQGIPGAALTVLAGAAHLANIEGASAFTAALIDHLALPAAERGDRVRRAVLGDAHVDRSPAGGPAFDAPFVDLITRYAWGEIWTRPGLDLRTRSSVTVALLAGLGRLGELPLHIRGARRNGLSDEDIAEVLLHTAIYAGVPAAHAAFAVAREVLEALDHETAGVASDGGAASSGPPGGGDGPTDRRLL